MKSDRPKSLRQTGSSVHRVGEGVSRGEWERIFGPEAARQARFKARLEAQRQAKRQALEASVEAGRVGPQVISDRAAKGYVPSLDITVEGRSHLNRVAKERGLRCVG